MIKKLSLSSISNFSEEVEIAFNQALEAAYKDCVDRPGLAKGREISLKLVLKPDPDERHHTMLDAATIDMEVGSKIPGKGISRNVKVSPRMGGFGFFDDTESLEYDEDQPQLPMRDDD